MIKARNDYDDLLALIYPEPPDSLVANARLPAVLLRVPSCLAIEKYVESIFIRL